jgi:hypothetical protein
LSKIEISPSGLGLHFPAIDADLYLPALLDGFLGSRRWMASPNSARLAAAPHHPPKRPPSPLTANSVAGPGKFNLIWAKPKFRKRGDKIQEIFSLRIQLNLKRFHEV